MTKEEIQKKLDDGDYVDFNETPFLSCDENCFALREPQTIDEFKAALEHWKSHSVDCGCSHGC